MSMKISAGEVKRAELFLVDPNEIIVNDDLRGRFMPPDESENIKLATTIFDHMQQNPIRCRRQQDKRIIVTSGFGRLEAVKRIRDGFLGTDGVFRHDAGRLVKVTISDTNEEEALVENIVENIARTATSVMDDAFNQRRLRDSGQEEIAIAKLYGYGGNKPNTGKVGQLRRLLRAPRPIQEKLHRGEMSFQAVLDLLDLPQDDWDEVLNKSQEENGKISTATVRSTVRAKLLDRHEAETEEPTVQPEKNGEALPEVKEPVEPAPKRGRKPGSKTKKPVAAKVNPVKVKSRSVAELRVYWSGVAKDHEDSGVQQFAKLLLGHVGGLKTDQQMSNAVDKLLDAVRS